MREAHVRDGRELIVAAIGGADRRGDRRCSEQPYAPAAHVGRACAASAF